MGDYIGPVTDALIDNIIKEVKRKKNKEKIMNDIIDPLLRDLATRYYPHLMSITMILIIMVILLISILVMLVLQKCEKKCYDN
jgi:hypothetical protein